MALRCRRPRCLLRIEKDLFESYDLAGSWFRVLSRPMPTPVSSPVTNRTLRRERWTSDDSVATAKLAWEGMVINIAWVPSLRLSDCRNELVGPVSIPHSISDQVLNAGWLSEPRRG